MKKKYLASKHSVTPDERGKVLHYFDITPDEMEELLNVHGLDSHNIASALDQDEVPRMEYDRGILTIIWKIPTNFKLTEISSFNVTTMGIFVTKKNLILISTEEKTFFSGSYSLAINDLFDIVLIVMDRTVKHFVEHLRVIKMLSKQIQQKINASMGNEYLLQMFNLSEILIYYLDAINSNKAVMVKFGAYAEKKGLGDIDFLQDLTIEIEQAAKQTEIYSQVFTGLMDARGSIVNNNMNALIKKLTVINIIFLPLNLIAGIGGMSEFSMMTKGFSWPLAYGVFSIAMVVIGIFTYRFLAKIEGIDKGKKKK